MLRILTPHRPIGIMPSSVPGNHPRRGFWHWSAGGYTQDFADYTYTILGDSRATVHQHYSELNIPQYATWHENSDSVDIALLCMADGRLGGDWPLPPLALQVERACYLAAEISHRWRFPIESWLTHCEIATRDGYGPDSGDPNLRWDLISTTQKEQGLRNGGDVMRRKARWYADKYFPGTP